MTSPRLSHSKSCLKLIISEADLKTQIMTNADILENEIVGDKSVDFVV